MRHINWSIASWLIISLNDFPSTHSRHTLSSSLTASMELKLKHVRIYSKTKSDSVSGQQVRNRIRWSWLLNSHINDGFSRKSIIFVYIQTYVAVYRFNRHYSVYLNRSVNSKIIMRIFSLKLVCSKMIPTNF